MACSSWLALPAFLDSQGPGALEYYHLRGAGSSHISLNLENTPTTLPTDRYGGSIFSIEVSSSLMTLAVAS